MKIGHLSKTKVGMAIAAISMVGCAVKAPEPAIEEVVLEEEVETPITCQVPAENDQLIGNWLSKQQEKGMVGELRTLITLYEDGTMAYTQQIKRPRNPSQGFSETGCWHRQGNEVVLQTLESNGVEVDTYDPMYQNSFIVRQPSNDTLQLLEGGKRNSFTRTSLGYRLPF